MIAYKVSDFRVLLMRRWNHLQAGFTLVELLVVISIIASLVAIILPALSRARGRAEMVVCQSNMHQIGVALQTYINENNDKFPDAYTTGNYGFRMKPGAKTQSDPYARPEVYGLAAVLHGIRVTDDLTHGLPRASYMPGDSRAWVCPSSSDMLKGYGNTYSFSIAQVLVNATSIKRYKTPDSIMVWDNFTQYPWLTGSRAGSPGPGTTIPEELRTYPHRRRVSGGLAKGAISELYWDLHVGVRDIQ